MPSFLRRRKISCFYCGQASFPDDTADYHPNGRVSKYICPFCKADNHFDQRGEIIDYVPEEPSQFTSFAHRRLSTRAAKPPVISNNSSDLPSSSSAPTPFCTSCEHNQLILQSARNNYDMPPEDHPDYEYHANVLYPQYMKDFEARYPPVCANCIPKVKEKLKQVNYNAKVASLGQMLARSERPLSSPRQPRLFRTLKWAIWVARGVIWTVSNALFLLWHLSGIIHANTDRPFGKEYSTWATCIFGSLSKSEVDAGCYDVTNNCASRYFPLTLLGFWWLYRQWEVEHNLDKKLVGGREYLSIEVAVVIIRTIAWSLLREGGRLTLAPTETQTYIHAGFFFINFVSFLFAITCLKLEDPPSFSLRETLPPSPDKPAPPSPPRSTTPNFSTTPSRRPIVRKQPLSVNQTPPLRPVYPRQPIPPITPSYREGGSEYSPSPSPYRRTNEDEMDWDPITPTPPSNIWAPRGSPELSPTRSTNISSAPLSGRLRGTPLLKPTEIRFGQQRTPQPSIFSTKPVSTDPVKPRLPPLAEPKFRRIAPPSDTGLEGLFDGGLKLMDEPSNKKVELQTEHETLTGILSRLIIIAVAAVIALFAPPGLKLLALPAVVTAALWRMLKYAGSTRILSALEVLGALLTGGAVALGAMDERVLENVGTALVSVAGLAEMWRLLLRMQRQRMRNFWEEERKRQLEAEKDRARSQSPVGSFDEFGFRRANSRSPAMGTATGSSFNLNRSFGGL